MSAENAEPVFTDGEVVTVDPTGVDLTIEWAKGSRFGKANPEDCYKEVVEVANAFGGKPPDGALMEKAKNKKSAMHQLFDWNKNVAAKKWWIHTERLIKAQLVYIKKGTYERKVHQIRVLTKIKETTEDGKKVNVFYNTFDVLKDPEKKKQLLERAKHDMRIFQNRYELLEELSEVMDPIKAFLDK